MKYKISLGCFLMVLTLFAARAGADNSGVITFVEGRVDGQKSGAADYSVYTIEDKVGSGDAVRTKGYSKAEITFADGSKLRLGDNTQVRILDYQLDDLGFRKTASIAVDRGSVRAIVAKTKDKAPFDISTPNASGTVKGSDIFVSFQKSMTSVLVDEGVFTAVNPAFPDKSVSIGKGKTAVIPFDAPPEKPRDFIQAEKDSRISQTGPSEKLMDVSTLKNAETTRATIRKLSGAVQVQPNGATVWHTPTINEVLNAGDKIQTRADGIMEFSVENGHVISLRENSVFIIDILRRDSKTGAYENIFECKYGKIKAKIQKVTPGSSFQVKTPTAICGVRGTIMYLNVQPTGTDAFFEGGDGFMTNNDGETFDIPGGNSGSSDEDGDVTDNGETSDEERDEFGSDFGDDSGDDGESGYSDSGDGEGGDLGGDLGGGEGGGEGGDLGGDTGGDTLFDEVVPDDSTGDDTTEDEEPAPTSATTDGAFSLASYENSDNTAEGVCALTTNAPAWAGTASLDMSGTFIQYGSNKWALIGDVNADNSVAGDYTGKIVAASGGDQYSWIGYWASLYVDSEGEVGTIYGKLSGTHDDADYGDFEGTDIPLEVVKKGSGFGTTIAVNVDDQDGSLKGAFTSDGDTGTISSDDIKASFLNIVDENWGVWSLSSNGTSDNSNGEGSTWDVSQRVLTKDSDGQRYLWLGKISGQDLSNNSNLEASAKYFVFRPLHEKAMTDGFTASARYLKGNMVGEHYGGEDGAADDDKWTVACAGVWDEVSAMTDLTDPLNFVDILRQDMDVMAKQGALSSLDSLEAGTNSWDISGLFAGDSESDITVDPITIQFYAYAPYYFDEGWWKIDTINGSYTGVTGNSWSLQLSSGGEWLKFYGIHWIGTKWFALVQGCLAGKDLAGVASGDFAESACPEDCSGTFTGSAVGGWTAYESETEGTVTQKSFITDSNYDCSIDGTLTLTTKQDYWPGSGSALFTGNISGYNSESQSLTFISQISNESGGERSMSYDTGGSQSKYFGWVCGSNRRIQGEWVGYGAALFVDEKNNKGIMSGDFAGTYAYNADTQNYEIGGTADALSFTRKADTEGYYQYEDKYFQDASMSGYVRGGAGYALQSDEASYFDLAGFMYYDDEGIGIHDKWGVWAMTNVFYGAEYDLPGANAIDMTVYGKDTGDMFYLGKLTGDDSVKGDFTGFAYAVDDKSVKYLTGKSFGEHYNFDGGEEWRVSSAGEWVEVDELLDTSTITELVSLTEDLYDRVNELSRSDIHQLYPLADNAMIPLSDQNAILNEGSFVTAMSQAAGSIELASMDVNFFGNTSTSPDGFWTSNEISGIYSYTGTDAISSWSLNFDDGSYTVNFNGIEWADSRWFATIDGTFDLDSDGYADRSIGGTATGSYDAATGTFTGTGVGAWQETATPV